MKKIFLFLVLALSSMSIWAQHTVYCEIMQFNPAGLGASVISVDFGNKGADELVDENGKKIKFNSSIDVLMYMEKRGWNVVSAFSVIHDPGISKAVPVVHYLMKKIVSDYSEIMNGIHTKIMNGIHTKKATTQQKQKKTLGDDGYFN